MINNNHSRKVYLEDERPLGWPRPRPRPRQRPRPRPRGDVLVLATAVITVQVDLLLPQPIVLKVVVEIGYDGIGPLAATVTLINEVVDLPGDALHAHSKDAHLPGDQKVQGARLHREKRQVHLLAIVKTEVHCKVSRTRRVWSKRRAASCSVSSLGILYHVLVEGVLHEYQV